MSDAADNHKDSTNSAVKKSDRTRPFTCESQEAVKKTIPEVLTDTIYVSNLHPRIAEVHLQKLFGTFGEIRKINILRKHVSKTSIAFVEFECSPLAVRNAINKVDGQKLLGLSIHVSPAHGKKDARIAIGERITLDKNHSKRIADDTQRKIDCIRQSLTKINDSNINP